MLNPLNTPARLLKLVAKSKVADFAIYTGMASYILLFIFRDYEIYILWTDIALEAIKIPYFFKIKEKAIVNESFFYMGANLLAISIGTDAFDSHIRECITGIMLLR
jgi:hypothetical protein